DVAEAARHADAIRLDQSFLVVVVAVLVVALRIPLRLRGFVEVGVREEAQAEDAGAVAVVGAGRQLALAARAVLDAGVFLFVLERIGPAVAGADVEAKAPAVGPRLGILLEARLVYEAV